MAFKDPYTLYSIRTVLIQLEIHMIEICCLILSEASLQVVEGGIPLPKKFPLMLQMLPLDFV